MDAEPTLQNDPLDVTGLPQLDDADFVALEPAYLRARLSAWAVVGAVIIVVTSVIATFVQGHRPLIGVIGLAAILVIAGGGTIAGVETRLSGYLLRERDVSYRSGVITRTVVSVPFIRVQNVSVERSGVERAFGLSSITIRTAGGLSGSVTIPGLSPVRAESLKEAILERSVPARS